MKKIVERRNKMKLKKLNYQDKHGCDVYRDDETGKLYYDVTRLYGLEDYNPGNHKGADYDRINHPIYNPYHNKKK